MREDKRKRILDAAIDVFAENGFFSTKVSEIAKTAQVADGTIYLYFKSKDDILISLFEEKMSEILTRFYAGLESIHDPEARVRQYILEHLTLAAEQPRLMQVLTVELRQSGRFMRQYSQRAFARYLRLVGTLLEDGQQKGVFRQDVRPAVFRRILFGAIEQLAIEWMTRSSGPDPKEVAAELADFVIRGLKTE